MKLAYEGEEFKNGATISGARLFAQRFVDEGARKLRVESSRRALWRRRSLESKKLS
jgi:hypothetical protein